MVNLPPSTGELTLTESMTVPIRTPHPPADIEVMFVNQLLLFSGMLMWGTWGLYCTIKYVRPLSYLQYPQREGGYVVRAPLEGCRLLVHLEDWIREEARESHLSLGSMKPID